MIERFCALLSLLLLSGSILHAQTWNPSRIWERTFGDAANRLGYESQIAVDERFHIHVLGSNRTGEGYEDGSVTYAQLLPNGDSVQQLRYGGAEKVYWRYAMRIGGSASPALGMLRDAREPGDVGDTLGEFVVIRIAPDGWPIDTLASSVRTDPGLASYGGGCIAEISRREGGFAVLTNYGGNLWGTHSVITQFDSSAQPVSTGEVAGVHALCTGPASGYYLIYGDDGGESSFGICSVAVERIGPPDALGSTQWREMVAYEDGSCVFDQAVAMTEDSGVIAVAHRYMNNGDRVAATLSRFDSSGANVWTRLLDPSAGFSCRIDACLPTSDGGFLCAGSSAFWTRLRDSLQKFYLLKLDGHGRTVWEWTYGPDTTANRLTSVALSGDTIIVAGVQGARLYVAKLMVDVAGVASEDPADKAALHIAPNPSSGRARIDGTLPRSGNVRIEIADLRGTVIHTEYRGVRRAGPFSSDVDLATLPFGRYLVRLIVDDALIALETLVRQ